MRREEVQIGKCYRHKGRIVRIVQDHGDHQRRSFSSSFSSATKSYRRHHDGWTAVNEATNRTVHVKSAVGLSPTCQGSAPTITKEAAITQQYLKQFENSMAPQTQAHLAHLIGQFRAENRIFFGDSPTVRPVLETQDFHGDGLWVTDIVNTGTNGVVPDHQRIVLFVAGRTPPVFDDASPVTGPVLPGTWQFKSKAIYRLQPGHPLWLKNETEPEPDEPSQISGCEGQVNDAPRKAKPQQQFHDARDNYGAADVGPEYSNDIGGEG